MKPAFLFSCAFIQFLILALALAYAAPFRHKQSATMTAVVNSPVAVSGAMPGFVNETSKNSTLTNAVGTNPTGQTACAAYSYCIPYTDAVLSGNLGIITGHYAHTSTAVTMTATDDKSDSYTCTNGSAADSGTHEWPFACYSSNLTAGAHLVTVTFGTTAVTQVMGKAAQFYNIALSSPVDGTPCGFTGSSSTSGTGCVVTTTQSNSLVYALFCRAGTPATDKFTAGSGFALITTDINNGCASEWEAASSAGSVTPTMTLATSTGSTYIGFVIAFKSATAGTAPSGWYSDKLASWSSPNNLAGQTFNFQFPSKGDFLFFTGNCGDMTPGTITDGTNTWTSTGGATVNGGGPIVAEDYVANATANATGLISVATTATSGDCTFAFYDFTGAPSSVIVSRQTNNFTGGAAATLLWQNLNGPDGTANKSGWLPDPSSGIAIIVGGQVANTTTNFSTPAAPSPCVFDAGFYGGMSLTGPEPIDENNAYGHCYFTAGAQPWYTFSQSSSSTSVMGIAGDIVGVFGSGMGIDGWTENQGTSTPLTITPSSTKGANGYAPMTAGDLFVVIAGVYNSTARTISTVKCNNGATTAFTQFSGGTSTGSGHAATSIWYILNAPSGCTAITETASGASANIEGQFIEISKNGGSWSTDGANELSNSTGSGTTATGASVTTTGTADACLAIASPSNTITAAPKSGNEFTYAQTLFTNTTDGAVSLITTSATAHAPTFTLGTSGDSFSASTGCFK